MDDKRELTINEVNAKFKEAFQAAADSGCLISRVVFRYSEECSGAVHLTSVEVDYSAR